MPSDAHPFGVFGSPELGSWMGELITGYRVCPADCEVLEFFEERTREEVSAVAACSNCGNRLESIVKHRDLFT